MKQSLEAIETAKNLKELAAPWFTFLTAFKAIYTTLEKGSKVSAPSRQWYGGKARERRADDLLQYLYEARNDEEHGLESAPRHVAGDLMIGVARPGASRSMLLNSLPDGGLLVTCLDGRPPAIVTTPSRVVLSPVSAPGNRTLTPPTRHLGEPIRYDTPFSVATAGYAYATSLVEEASKLP